MRQTFYNDGNIHVEVEEHDGRLFAHCTIEQWKPSVGKLLLRVFHTLIDAAKQPIYTISENYKFVEFLGFRELENKQINNTRIGYFVWDMKF